MFASCLSITTRNGLFTQQNIEIAKTKWTSGKKTKIENFVPQQTQKKCFPIYNVWCLWFILRCSLIDVLLFTSCIWTVGEQLGSEEPLFGRTWKMTGRQNFCDLFLNFFLFVFPGIYQVVMKTVFVLESWWRRFEPNLKFSFWINTKKNIFIAMRPGFRTRVYFNSRNSTGENCHIEFA